MAGKTNLTDLQRLHFIGDALKSGALIFGDFQAKSGRSTPYFFNSSAMLADNRSLCKLARYCAELIAPQRDGFDVLFGMAYKGIPLVAAAAACLLSEHGIHKSLAFDRKETKRHGEGGRLIGAEVSEKRVLILDDVLTTGTAFTNVLPLIEAAGGQVTGLVVLFDRREVNSAGEPTRPSLESAHRVKIHAVAQLQDLFDYIDSSQEPVLTEEQLTVLKAYQKQYGY